MSQTAITVEGLVEIGGIVEDKRNVRFGREIAYQSGNAWYLAYQSFRTIEDVQAWLKKYGGTIGWRAEK